VLAAPAFVGAALKLHLAQSVIIGEDEWALVRLTIEPSSRLIGQTISELDADEQLTVLLHARHDRLDVPPWPQVSLRVEDEIVVLVGADRLRRLAHENRTAAPIPETWV
jgi:Trk K+ transport system NAD-binding subunit